MHFALNRHVLEKIDEFSKNFDDLKLCLKVNKENLWLDFNKSVEFNFEKFKKYQKLLKNFQKYNKILIIQKMFKKFKINIQKLQKI